ncbi:capsid protein [Brachypodium phoenicoides associated virus 2]|nr:capsid protein [Brachypodium phoenicoides associated virus 2]
MPSGSGSRRRTRSDWAWDSRSRRRVRPRTTYVRRGPRVIRPSLQVDEDSYHGNDIIKSPTSDGVVGLLTNFTRGSEESSRHTSETILYKVSLDFFITVDAQFQKYSGRGINVCWLVYDAQPSAAAPSCKSIFSYNTDLATQPITWKVGREVCHRFVVKRRWVFTLETNGYTAGTDLTGKPCVPPCNRSVYFHKFCKRLGCRTEWKNSSGGTLGDIKTGALLSCSLLVIRCPFRWVVLSGSTSNP